MVKDRCPGDRDRVLNPCYKCRRDQECSRGTLSGNLEGQGVETPFRQWFRTTKMKDSERPSVTVRVSRPTTVDTQTSHHEVPR